MKHIILTRYGKPCGQTLVDDEDYARFSQSNWGMLPTGYACRGQWIDGRAHKVYLHRQIMEAPVGIQIDHINGDKLDNRRANLRLATNAQNHANMKKRAGGTSQYKGVSWGRTNKKWRARIKVNQKLIYLGDFNSEQDAAKAYNAAAQQYFGEYARINEV